MVFSEDPGDESSCILDLLITPDGMLMFDSWNLALPNMYALGLLL